MSSSQESASRSSSAAADSYIGCLISLTSKSEIRYEGILYNINTDESSIGLRNVRSFGTEGRKMDGQQIPPSDKVYEYILFRGSDIKDLQVKSSPPVQPTPQVNIDPAIIQSHYPRPATTSTSLPSAVSGSLTDLSSHHTAQLGLPGSNFQGPLPLYQPGGNIGSWGASPAPNASGGGLPMPVYWQGYYGAPGGLPHLHQQPLLRPPPGLAMHSSIQQPMQYPNFSLSSPAVSSNLPELPSSLLPASTSTTSVTSASLPLLNFPPAPSALPPAPAALSPAPSALPRAPSALPPAPSATLASEILPVALANKATNVSTSAVSLASNFPSLTPLTNSGPDVNAIVPPVSSKPNAISGSGLLYQTVSQFSPALMPPVSSKPNVISGSSLPYQTVSQFSSALTPPVSSKPNAISGSGLPNQTVSQFSPAVVGSSHSIHTDTPAPALVTPGQLLQPGPTKVSYAQPSQAPNKDVEVVQVSSTSSAEPSRPVSAETQPPILPLPVNSRPNFRAGGAPIQTHYGGYNYRGRGRGRGTAGFRPVTKFTEDFDFTAMNEKFKKDEVWGHLGKSNKSHSKDKDGEENAFDEDYNEEEDNDDSSNAEVKPVYNKDDFFDSLSSNVSDNASQNGRTRYSEQIKIDTEILHPLLMVIGFIILSGEAILVHRWLPGSRSLKKSVHLCLQGVALTSGIFGIWTKFQGQNGIVANFYSLHSWMGLLCVSLFGAQWLMGFLNFWHRGEARSARIRILPWHIFLGLYTYGLAIATAETGLLEKLTLLQTKRNVPKHSTESIVVNSLGLGLALLSCFVILAAVSPKYQSSLQSKLLYLDTRCLSS